ncbi:MAG: acyl carrier protein [Clostridia bacterium]|nr:acyl carrier protein [Clostridia bacterium]
MLERLKAILTRVVPDVDMDTVTESTTLIDDLGFDSLAIMMMSMEIEDAFGFRFTEFVKFETVGDVCRYVENKATK